jgi:predicted outer membrane repeat protein
MMEFNYLLENRALSYGGGIYSVDYARIPAAIAALAKELLEIETTGDRRRAENWHARYDKMPDELVKALAGTTDIPVDIDPVFSFKDEVR